MIVRTTTRIRVGFATLLAIVLVAACASHAAVGPVIQDSAEPAPATPVVESQVEAQDGNQEATVIQVVGVWEGSLKVQGAEIDIVVKFLSDPTAADVDATMDIPAQMAYGLPLTNVNATGAAPGSDIHFELATSGPTLVADLKITEDGAISGVFTQGAASGEIVIARVGDLDPADLPEADQTSNGIETGATGFSFRHYLQIPGT